MTTAPLRLIGALTLGGQLLPLGLPLLCRSTGGPSAAGCEQSMTPVPKGVAIGAATGHASCANPAFCAVTPTAIAADFAVTLAPSAIQRTTPPVVPAVNAGD